MLLTIYILFQIIVLIGVIMTFYSKEMIFSALTMLFSGMLAVGAWRITYGTNYIWDATTSAYVAETLIASTPYIAYLNMGLFGLALMFFYYDVFETLTGQSKGLGNLNLNRNKKTLENIQ